MYRLSVIIPGLNEEFMQNTIDSVLESSSEETEVICILDGYWPEKGIKNHERLTVVHNEEPLGQRAATNQGVKLSDAEFIMKLDAHCKVSPGFDKELMSTCKYDWTMIPRMYTLDAFHWVCPDCKKEWDQGPLKTECDACGGKNVYRKIIWDKKERKRTDYMWINDDLRMKYFDKPGLSEYGDVKELKKRCSPKEPGCKWSKGDITDVMTCIGAGWFMHRKRYWELGGMDEDHGSWGQMAVELSFKAWLSGGRMVVNKRCWFAHLARTQKGFGFPYAHKRGAIDHARKHSRDMWLKNKWPKAIHTYDWLIKKFSPLPGWVKEQEGEWNIEPPMVHDTGKEYEKKDEEDQIIHQEKLKLYNRGITKGIVYYTDHRCEERLLWIVREQIERSCNGMPIVSVSQSPLDFGKNVVINEKPGVITMFKQIVAGLEALDTDVAFLCEHDVIYHPTHFEFTPPADNTYYYNLNCWSVNLKDGRAVYYDSQRLSQICCDRKLLLECFKKKIEQIEEHGWHRKFGFEPGQHPPPRGVDNYGFQTFRSREPNIDVKHGSNLTYFRDNLDQFRKKPKNFQTADEVPFWGKTKKRFDRLLHNIKNCKIKIEDSAFNKM